MKSRKRKKKRRNNNNCGGEFLLLSLVKNIRKLTVHVHLCLVFYWAFTKLYYQWWKW